MEEGLCLPVYLRLETAVHIFLLKGRSEPSFWLTTTATSNGEVLILFKDLKKKYSYIYYSSYFYHYNMIIITIIIITKL